jgi:hypothetical protein
MQNIFLNTQVDIFFAKPAKSILTTKSFSSSNISIAGIVNSKNSLEKLPNSLDSHEIAIVIIVDSNVYIPSCLSTYYNLNGELNLSIGNTPIEISRDLNNIDTILRDNG